MLNWVKSIALGALALLVYGLFQAVFGATTLLPPGEQCFQTGAGPVSSGSVNMYIPGTTTAKNTWKDSGQSALNTNPIQLDANGCAIIYGTGSYRQQLYSGPVVGGLTTGNLIFDQATADTSSYQNVFWAGLSGGTPNAITVTDAGFNSTDGSVINFLALNTNTGAATLNVSGAGPLAIELPSSAGPIALTAGQITANNPVSVVWSSSANAFLLLTGVPLSTGGGIITAAVPAPGGYLTLSSDATNPITTSDFSGSTSVYYTPYVSNQVPIWNGSSFTVYTFNQLQLNLTGSQSGSNIYDVCAFINNNAVTLATEPAWSNSAAGAGARGTGAGTSQLQRTNGLLVNAVSITGLNGANTYTIPALQCTYLGSILIDSSAGQVSTIVSYGQNRKWGVWNAYNRQTLVMQAGDTTSSWNYATNTWRASNNSSSNKITVFTGLAEEPIDAVFSQLLQENSNSAAIAGIVGIGIDSTSVPTGFQGTFNNNAAASQVTISAQARAEVLLAPFIGIHNVQSLEIAPSGTVSFNGAGTNMLLTARYRG